ncbi:MAG: GNAT family N-acetyltransferase [Chloroflexi bacterium]|nr:GNAT family N-acetyltransferase [Chloroflexota bacterium]
MTIAVREIGPEELDRYGQVSIAFDVREMLEVEGRDGGLGGLSLRLRPVEPPYRKDYDDPATGELPSAWPRQFDVRNWAFFLAERDGQPVGAAAVAFDTPGVHMLAGRRDLAVLWDIRVSPDCRREGVGRMLFRRAGEWARARGCAQLKIETQNINVAACRFYRAQGCHLGEINRYAYWLHPPVAHEVMLVWYLAL